MKRAARPVMLVLIAVVLTGCRSTTISAGDPASRTGGIAVELYTRGENLEAVYYRVYPEGRIAYAGGQSAYERETQWEGPLTDEEITRLRERLDGDGWWTGRVTTTGEPAQREWEIQIARPGGGQRYRLTGDGREVLRLRSLLDEIARKRLDPFLETLPKPSRPGDAGESAESRDPG